MKRFFYQKQNIKDWISPFLALLLVVTLVSQNSYAQLYATTNTSGRSSTSAPYIPTGTSVITPENATDATYTNTAILNASGVSVNLGLGTISVAGNSYIEMTFPGGAGVIPAGKTSYVRIDIPTFTGVSLDLSSLANLLNLFEQGLIKATVPGGGVTTTTLVIDAAKNYYLAVTPTNAYNTIRVTLDYAGATGLGLALGAAHLNVYYAMYDSNFNCGLPKYTDLGKTQSVASVTLTTPITRPEEAIDNSETTFSVLGSGLVGLGVAQTVSQTIYFTGTSGTTDELKVLLSLPGTILSVGVLGSLKVAAFNGSNLVGSETTLSSLVNIGLLTNNQVIPFHFAPGGAFNRVTISYSAVIPADVLGGGINIYDVKAVPAKPTLSKHLVYIFPNTTPLVTATSTGNTIVWQGALPATTQIGTGGAFPTSVASNGDYIALAKNGTCANLSDSTKLRVVVITDASVTIPKGVSGKPLATGGIIKGTSPDHTFTFTQTGAPAGVSLNGTTGAITATTLPTVATTTTYPITVTIFENGVSTGLTLTKNLVVYPGLVANNGALPFGIENKTYGASGIPAPTGGSGAARTYAVNSGALPSGLTLNPDGTFSGEPTTDGTYSFVVRITDTESGEFIDQTYSNVKVYDQLLANPTPFPNSYQGAPTYGLSLVPVPAGGSGTTGSYTYLKTTGDLPTGLSVSSTGVVSGTTTTPGTYTFAVVVTDPISGQTVTQPYTVVVSPQLLLPGGTFPSVSISLNTYTKNIAVATNGTTGTGVGTGGKSGATLVYSLTAPNTRVSAIPTSFTLAPNGDLSGNPSAAGQGTNTFTVFVTDGEQTTQNTYTVQITGPLPVTLTSFIATREGQTAQLKWSTTEETNSDRFEIERSQNGKNWDLIGTQKSNGESTSLKNYTFSDIKPLNGENLYRLKMIDRDATFAYSRIQSLTFASDLVTSFYPNPVAEKLIIKTDDFSLVKNVKIFDANGRTVYQSSATPSSEINVQNLSAGLYIVQMTSKSGAVISHKVVKQ